MLLIVAFSPPAVMRPSRPSVYRRSRVESDGVPESRFPVIGANCAGRLAAIRLSVIPVSGAIKTYRTRVLMVL
jgi:hypothetical protein